jgi:hypothetical protein
MVQGQDIVTALARGLRVDQTGARIILTPRSLTWSLSSQKLLGKDALVLL